MEDVTGQPRPRRDIEAALKHIETEMVKNPLRMGADGSPTLIHYTVIRDVLREALVRAVE